MDCKQVGQLIFNLRKEKKMTQKQLADSMNISDKTISKWERGLGCPDVSLLSELSNILEVNIEQILSGRIDNNETDGGNMKKIKFYVCPECGNIINSISDAEISCCGRKLKALVPQAENDTHKLKIEEIEYDYYITFNHSMTKEHYISFVAYGTCNRLLLVRLYPEQSGEVRFPKMYEGKLYFYCNKDGLFSKDVR